MYVVIGTEGTESEPAQLIIVCGLFPTEGPYLIVEHLSTNPQASGRLKKLCYELGVNAIRVVATALGKVAWASPSIEGVKRVLQAGGFQESPAVQMLAPLGAVLYRDNPPPQAASSPVATDAILARLEHLESKLVGKTYELPMELSLEDQKRIEEWAKHRVPPGMAKEPLMPHEALENDEEFPNPPRFPLDENTEADNPDPPNEPVFPEEPEAPASPAQPKRPKPRKHTIPTKPPAPKAGASKPERANAVMARIRALREGAQT
jgi:hypothetical protein